MTEAVAIEGDFFDRQRRVPGWSHETLEGQVALVLGVGGIGSTCAMALCRLGVKKLFLIDKDYVEASNLNRQILFSVQDVGQPKVQAGMNGLQHHNLRTEIVPLHMNAIDCWEKVVACAKESTVVFNCIDHGQYFDYAVTSLACALNIPYCTAASYGHTSIVEQFPNHANAPCWACHNAPTDLELLAKLSPEKIATYKTLDVISKMKDDVPQTRQVGSSVLPCSIASHLMVAAWVNAMFKEPIPNWGLLTLNDFMLASFPVERNPLCPLCVGRSVPLPVPSSDAAGQDPVVESVPEIKNNKDDSASNTLNSNSSESEETPLIAGENQEAESQVEK